MSLSMTKRMSTSWNLSRKHFQNLSLMLILTFLSPVRSGIESCLHLPITRFHSDSNLPLQDYSKSSFRLITRAMTMVTSLLPPHPRIQYIYPIQTYSAWSPLGKKAQCNVVKDVTTQSLLLCQHSHFCYCFLKAVLLFQLILDMVNVQSPLQAIYLA